MGASVDVYLLCCVISKNISLEDGSLRLPPYGGEDVGGNLVVLHFLPIFFMTSVRIYLMTFFLHLTFKAILCELGRSLGVRVRNELKEKLISN